LLPSIPLSEGLRRMIAHDFLGEGGDGIWFEGGDN